MATGSSSPKKGINIFIILVLLVILIMIFVYVQFFLNPYEKQQQTIIPKKNSTTFKDTTTSISPDDNYPSTTTTLTPIINTTITPIINTTLTPIINTITVTYRGKSGTEVINIDTDKETLLSSSKISTTAKTITYTVSYTPKYIAITYTNDTTDNDLYIDKLQYNGKDLLSSYTNTSSSVQSTVRSGVLAWGNVTYIFYIT